MNDESYFEENTVKKRGEFGIIYLFSIRVNKFWKFWIMTSKNYKNNEKEQKVETPIWGIFLFCWFTLSLFEIIVFLCVRHFMKVTSTVKLCIINLLFNLQSSKFCKAFYLNEFYFKLILKDSASFFILCLIWRTIEGNLFVRGRRICEIYFIALHCGCFHTVNIQNKHIHFIENNP